VSIAAVPAAEAVGARAAAAGGASKAASASKALPYSPHAHVTKLRSQGMDNQGIRKALRDKGYDAETAQNAAPGIDEPPPSAAPASSPSSGAADTPSSSPVSDTASSSSSEYAGFDAPRQRSLPERVGARLPSGGSGSGLLLGLVLYPLALAFLRDGPGGVKAWLKAKFLNQVTYPASSGKSGLPHPATPGHPAVPSPGAGGGGGGGGGSSF